MANIMRLRRRLPLVVFILLVLLALMLLGFACACLTDHPMQAVERALSVIPALPAFVDVWVALLTALAGSTAIAAGAATVAVAGRSSPAFTQRFRF